MPIQSDDKVIRLIDRRRPQTVRPIDPASLARIYEGPRPRRRLIGLPEQRPSRRRQTVDVIMIALIILTIFYFAAEFARAYIAGRL